jgi:hypothetical protein
MLLIALIVLRIIWFFSDRALDRMAESTEESMSRYERNIFVRLYRAIIGALFGPDSHSSNRYVFTPSNKKYPAFLPFGLTQEQVDAYEKDHPPSPEMEEFLKLLAENDPMIKFDKFGRVVRYYEKKDGTK